MRRQWLCWRRESSRPTEYRRSIRTHRTFVNYDIHAATWRHHNRNQVEKNSNEYLIIRLASVGGDWGTQLLYLCNMNKHIFLPPLFATSLRAILIIIEDYRLFPRSLSLFGQWVHVKQLTAMIHHIFFSSSSSFYLPNAERAKAI